MKNKTNKRAGITGVFALLMVFLVLITFLVNRVGDCDTGYHLKAGEYILSNLRVPGRDVFSHTAYGNPWIDSQWLYQVVLYASYALLGPNGMILLQLAVYLAAFALFRKMLSSLSRPFITCSLFLLSVMIINERFIIRPEMFSFLFLLIYLRILGSYKRGSGSKSIYLLPLLQVLWTNMHSMFILGIIVIFIHMLCELINSKLRLPFDWNDKVTTASGKDKKLIITALLACMACFLNPYFIKGAVYPFLLLAEIGPNADSWMSNIPELISPFSDFGQTQVITLYKAFILILAAGFILNLRKIRAFHVLASAAFLYLSATARRNIPLFIFLAAPVCAYNLETYLTALTVKKKLKTEPAGRAVEVVIIILSAVVIAGIVNGSYYKRNYPSKQFGFGIAGVYPEGAVDFIRDNDIKGNMFNSPDIGGYLIWQLGPGRKVFIDGRFEVYGPEFLSDYNRRLDSPVLWSGYLDEYKVNYMILTYKSSEGQVLLHRLMESPEWKLVYFDSIAAVFLRDTPENNTIIQNNRIAYRRDREKFIIEHRGIKLTIE